MRYWRYKICPTILHEEGDISNGLVLMFDGMFLQKCSKYAGSEIYGSNETGEFRSSHPEVFLRKVLWKYAANLQENTMPKCDFNKVAAYFQNTFS